MLRALVRHSQRAAMSAPGHGGRAFSRVPVIDLSAYTPGGGSDVVQELRRACCEVPRLRDGRNAPRREGASAMRMTKPEQLMSLSFGLLFLAPSFSSLAPRLIASHKSGWFSLRPAVKAPAHGRKGLLSSCALLTFFLLHNFVSHSCLPRRHLHHPPPTPALLPSHSPPSPPPQVGTFYVAGHGVAPELQRALTDHSRRFFAEPAEHKNTFAFVNSPHWRGGCRRR